MPPYGTARIRMPAGCLAAAALAALLLATAARGETIPTEVLVAPQLSQQPRIGYPEEEIRQNGEGWVNLGLMVDATGKPFEVTVTASSGNKVFERQAIEAVERARFKPGLLNGQPIESATEFKVVFVFAEPMKGARPEFVDRYQTLQKAIKAKDRSAADAAMKRLDVNNLYEDAYFGLGTYAYAREWGDETQQIAGLQRAIAHESGAHYLPKSAFQSVQIESLVLNVKLRHYAEAMALWASILRSGIDAAATAKLSAMMQQVGDIRRLKQSYALSGSMPDGIWQLGLFEPGFRINVSHGHISQVKLRCAKGFVRFAFEPDIEYQVATKYGDCTMELDGDPGTSFTMTQF
jgi:TonB family protein